MIFKDSYITDAGIYIKLSLEVLLPKALPDNAQRPDPKAITDFRCAVALIPKNLAGTTDYVFSGQGNRICVRMCS